MPVVQIAPFRYGLAVVLTFLALLLSLSLGQSIQERPHSRCSSPPSP